MKRIQGNHGNLGPVSQLSGQNSGQKSGQKFIFLYRFSSENGRTPEFLIRILEFLVLGTQKIGVRPLSHEKW